MATNPLSGRAPREQNRVPVLFALSSDLDNTIVPLEADPATGRLLVNSSGGGGGGGAVTVADGADVTQGAIADATVAAGATGTVSAKLRRLTTDLGTVNTSIASIDGKTPVLGQALAAASVPVVLTAAQITTLTPLSTVTANIGTTNGLALDATLTGGTQQTKVTDGTNILSVLKSDGTAAAQNAAMVAGTHLTAAFTTTTAQAVATTDAANYSWVTVHVTTQGGSSTVTFQTSNDNINWISNSLNSAANTVSALAVSTTSAGVMFQGPISGRYFRLNVTGIVSGTTAGTVEFMTMPRALNSLGVASAQSGTWTVGANSATGSAVPANAFYLGANDLATGNLIGVRAISNSTNTGSGILGAGLSAVFDDVSPTSITENNFGSVRMSANRNLYGTIRDAAGNERGANVTASNELVVSDSGLRPAGASLNTYSVRLTTNTTNTPTSSTAYISSIAIAVETAGTTSTITIRDKQGTPLVLVSALSTASLLANGDATYNFQTPVKMVSGIDIVTAGSVAAAVSVFVNYYQ